MASCLFNTVRPMSSAKARMLEVVGRFFESLSNSISMQRTNRVGDIGQPCRTPDLNEIEGKSSEPSFN